MGMKWMLILRWDVDFFRSLGVVGFGVLLLVKSNIIAQAQPPETLWMREYGEDAGDMVQSSIFVAPDGGVVFTALQHSQLSYIVKYDSSGNQLWNVPTYINDEVGGIRLLYNAIPVSGNRILATGMGYFQPGWPRAITTLFSADGDTIWRRAFDIRQTEVIAGAQDCLERDDGSFVIVGSGRRDADFPLTPLIPFIVCYSPEGEELWHEYYWEQSRQHTYEVTVYPRVEGGIGITSYTTFQNPSTARYRAWALNDTGAIVNEWNLFDIGLGPTRFNELSSRHAMYDGYIVDIHTTGVAKFDGDFNLLWSDTTTLDWIDNFTFVMGSHLNTDFLIGGQSEDFEPQGTDESLVIRMNQNREVVWTKVLVDPDSADHSAVPRVASRSDGSIYAVFDVGITGAHVVLARLARDTVQTSASEPTPIMPESHALLHVYPNPFNSTLSISLNAPLHQEVNVVLYDLLGREVDVVYRGSLSSSTISYVAPASLGSGVYFLRASVAEQSSLAKVVFLK